METRTNLDKWLYLVRRIEEHREEKAVKELQKLYKKLIKDLRGKMGNLYADYADPETGRLTYEALHRQGLDARLLEEVAANVASVTADESRIIRETVEQTYANCYSGMVQAVQQAVDNEELHEAFAAVEAVKPEVIRAAVDNPVHGLTLSDQLEKNRADIIWGIKQAVGVGLSEGDNYSTMARRIQKELIGPDGAGGSYYKAVRIARTEAHRVREEGNLDAAQNLTEQLEPSGITMMKTWHTMKDERVRPSRSRKTKDGWKYSKSGKYDHQKMEGVQVPIKEDFTLPSGAKTQAPGKSGVAGEDINCRCFLSYDVVRDSDILFDEDVLESDGISKRIINKVKSLIEKADVVSADELPDTVKKAFRGGLQNSNDKVKTILEREFQDASYCLIQAKGSYYRRLTDVIGLGLNSNSSTMAHELFHRIDTRRKVTAGKIFLQAFLKDFNGSGFAKNPVAFLQANYPQALTRKGSHVVLKEKYRGVSDIASALSGGKINLGYIHPNNYWTDTTRAKEIWAQYGRMYYDNDPDVIKMLEDLFPSGTFRVNIKLGVIKRNVVER